MSTGIVYLDVNCMVNYKGGTSIS